MLVIDRTYQGQFTVRQKDPGMGRGSLATVADLDAAFETVKHYYKQDHDRQTCGFCALMSKQERLEHYRQCRAGRV